MSLCLQVNSEEENDCVPEKSLTEEELEAVTVVFHQYETGLREGTIYTKVILSLVTRLEIL